MPKRLPEVTDGNVVKEEQAKGVTRPDGPGDATAPVKPERKSSRSGRAKSPAARKRATRR